MSRVVIQREDVEEDEMEPKQALPFPDDESSGSDVADTQQLPATADEYLRQVRRQAKKIPDIIIAKNEGLSR